MHLHPLLCIAVSIPSAFAKPISHFRFLPHEFVNSSILGITPTITDTDTSLATPETRSTCVAFRTITEDKRCGDVASEFGIRLSTFEADNLVGSRHCRALLLAYQICITITDDHTRTPATHDQAITTTISASEAASTSTTVDEALSLPTTNATISRITHALSPAFVIRPTTVTSEIVKTDTKLLTYTAGKGKSAHRWTATVTRTTTDIFTFYTTVTNTILFSTSTLRSSASAVIRSNSTIGLPGSASSTRRGNSTSTASTLASTRPPSSTSSSLTPTLVVSSTSLLSSVSSSSSSSVSSPSVSSTSVSSSPATCATAVPPAPTQLGIVSGCTQWYVAVSGDFCETVAERFDISVNTLMAWNPAVDPPTCPDMIAGDAYCVATCAESSTVSFSSTSSPTTSPTLSNPTLSSPTSTVSPTAESEVDVYRTYTGDGSVADGWPSEDQWVDFDFMFAANTPNMQASCAQWGVPDDSDTEVADMKTAIQNIAASTGVDERFILAIIMQESTGCVRVITTAFSVFNPGLMQSHNGTGTCNTNDAPLGLPGVVGDGVVQTPCPMSEIEQMIQDGTSGTSSGAGLEQLLQQQGHTDVSRFYRAARLYNGGSIVASGNLDAGCCTLCYVSDIANRLTGWVNAPHTCSLE